MSTHERDTNGAEFRLETFLPYRMAVIAGSISGVFASNYEQKFRLSLAEWRILATIAAYGTTSPTAVGRRAAMDKVKVSRAAQSLAAKGLVRRNQDPRDGRGQLLRLTRKGTATYEAMVPLAINLESEIFRGLTRADQIALNRILTKISTRIETIGPETDEPEEA